jgi:serine/threonine protein kinase
VSCNYYCWLQGKPYNESVDIFSMGVMLYELFSRTLLIYTHTPANSPADCEKYAGQIAQGFRPKHVKQIPAGVWEIIESCWEQDPADRPSAKKVLRKLQEQLQQAQEAAAAKGFGGKGFGKLLRSSNTAAGVLTPSAKQSSVGDRADGKAEGKAVGVHAEAAGPRRAEASCGCVIC